LLNHSGFIAHRALFVEMGCGAMVARPQLGFSHNQVILEKSREADAHPKDADDILSLASTSPPPREVHGAVATTEDPGSGSIDGTSEPAVPSVGCRFRQPQPLTDEERRAAWTAANFFEATTGHKRPVALWILGPSSVGKSTLTAQAGPRFGIPALHMNSDYSAQPGKDIRGQLDAVIIDGEFMRAAHGGWQQWVKSPEWRSAYPALKSTINGEKDKMCMEAAKRRQHLVIPQTCLNLHKGLTDLKELAQMGYVNHVFAVIAPLEECRRRGLSRELETGKRYQPLEFEQSISAVPSMIQAINGRYELVRAIEECDEDNGMIYNLLAACDQGEDVQPNTVSEHSFEKEYIRTVITNAIGQWWTQ